MQIIWDAKTSVTSSQLLEKLKSLDKDWRPTTVLTFLARLIEKGVLTSIRCGRSNMYSPLISHSKYRHSETRAFLDVVHEGSVTSFVATLYENDSLSESELDELKDWFSKIGEK
jgi:predicted transcriptional regulator